MVPVHQEIIALSVQLIPENVLQVLSLARLVTPLLEAAQLVLLDFIARPRDFQQLKVLVLLAIIAPLEQAQSIQLLSVLKVRDVLRELSLPLNVLQARIKMQRELGIATLVQQDSHVLKEQALLEQ